MRINFKYCINDFILIVLQIILSEVNRNSNHRCLASDLNRLRVATEGSPFAQSELLGLDNCYLLLSELSADTLSCVNRFHRFTAYQRKANKFYDLFLRLSSQTTSGIPSAFDSTAIASQFEHKFVYYCLS